MEQKGKVVVVTGAAQGLGRGIALAFMNEGSDLALIDVKQEKLEEVAQEIKTHGNRVVTCAVDVSSSQQVNEGFKKITTELGRIDILVNNAGILRRALVEDADDAHWNFMLGVNLMGAVYCSRAAIPFMKRNGGSIINCSSILGTFPNTASAAYGIAKQGIILLTRVMAAELAPYGIRVNAYCPGVANTEFAADVIATRGAEKLEQIALKKFGEPEDIADVVVFLASNKARYITGQTIAVDGGMWVTQTPGRRWKEVAERN
jgi:NAD(P)-dependent dehydrogenase (short-subunit alcohol dehydrogenase family)